MFGVASEGLPFLEEAGENRNAELTLYPGSATVNVNRDLSREISVSGRHGGCRILATRNEVSAGGAVDDGRLFRHGQAFERSSRRAACPAPIPRHRRGAAGAVSGNGR
jgi:hypothetical protein